MIRHSTYKFGTDGQGQHHLVAKLDPKNEITLLFLHGIGDSSENYLQLLNDPLLKRFNMLIPDHLGYGSSKNDDNNYKFSKNIHVLSSHIASLNINKPIIVIGHSMGGDIGALICSQISELQKQVWGFINIEGNVTKYDAFISKCVFEARERFAAWFNRFKNEIALGWSPGSGSYLQALNQASLEAFKQNGIELYENCVPSGRYTHKMAEIFVEQISIPKLFCFGNTTHDETKQFINDNAKAFPAKAFATDSHWLINTSYAAFVRTLVEFVDNCILLHDAQEKEAQERSRFLNP